MAKIDRLAGGSMSDIRESAAWIVKSYSGPLARGHQKLVEEHQWFSLLPQILNSSDAIVFPKSRIFADEGYTTTELHIQKLPKVTISKAIHEGRLTAAQAQDWADLAIQLLFDRVYAIRSATSRSGQVLAQHINRVAFARRIFSAQPRLAKLCATQELVINGNRVAGLQHFESLFRKFGGLLTPKMTFAIHGNLHFDNILIDPDMPPNSKAITFIDPRGDLLGPLHYDSGKLMTSAHSHYDEVHYDRYRIECAGESHYLLEIDPFNKRAYENLLAVSFAKLEGYAALDGTTLDNMISATLICEAVHTFSFAAYHASRAAPRYDRVEAYLLIAALLADKAARFVGTRSIADAYAGRLLSDN